MRVQRHPELRGHRPQRLVARVVVERQRADAGGKQDPAQAVLLRPGHLTHRLVEVVDGDHGDPGVAAGVQRAEVGEPPVVRPRADRLQLPVGALGAGATRRVERRRVVLGAVGEDHVGDDAVGLELDDAPVGVERAGSPTFERGLGVVLLGHELRVEELGHRLVEHASLLGGVLEQPVEVAGLDVLGEPTLRVGGARMAVGGDHGVAAHGEPA